jgi:hypothetical protein
MRVHLLRGILSRLEECERCWTGMATSLLASTDVTQLKLDLLPNPPPMTEEQRARYEKICMRCSWLSWRLNNPALKEPNPTARLRGGIRLCDSCARERPLTSHGIAEGTTAADVMYHERRGSFRAWLVEQSNRQDRVGELARDLKGDSCLGQKRTPNAILMHLHARHFPVADSTIRAFKEALEEWGKSKAK